MFRALYRLERGKKRLCGWVRDTLQLPESLNPMIQGTYFSGVLREETQIPQNDEWIIDDNNLLLPLVATTPVVQRSQTESVVVENNVSKLKEIFSTGILHFVPLESQLTGLLSKGEKFVSQQRWINDKLLLLKKGIEEIRSPGVDAFAIRNKYTRLLEESKPPESVSVLDLVDTEETRVPLVSIIPVKNQSIVEIGSGRAIAMALLTTDNSISEHHITNMVDCSYTERPLVTYTQGDDVIFSDVVLKEDCILTSAAGTISVEFTEPKKVENISLKCSDSTSNIYFSVDGAPQKYIRLNESYPLNDVCKSIKFKIPKRIQKIGPLEISILKSQIDESFQTTLLIPANSKISLTRDEEVSFCLVKNGSRYVPFEEYGLSILTPIKTPSKLSTAVYGGKYDPELTFTIEEECQLELYFTDSNHRVIDVRIEKLGERYKIQTILQWEQIGSNILLKDDISGELLVTKI